MAQRGIVLGDLRSPQEVQKLREYLIDLYGYVSLKVTEAKVETTDATVTTLITLPLDDNASYQIVANVVARRTGGSAGAVGDGASYRIIGTFRRVSAGSATLIGSLTVSHSAESQGAWNCTLTVSGNDVILTVVGAVNNNVTWGGIVTMQSV